MTELEKLKNADCLIRDMTEGRLQICSSIGNNIYVRSRDDAYVGMDMIIKSNYRMNCYDITFDAAVRRMGSPMTAKDLDALAGEVHQVQALLTALEMKSFHPTQKDMEQFHEYLLKKQQYAHTPPRLEQANSEMVMQ